MPFEVVELSDEELFTKHAEAGAVEEANRFKTVPTDTYIMQVIGAKGKVYKNRGSLHITGDVSKDGVKAGRVFFDASWETVRTSKGYLDKQTKLWGQILSVLYPELSNTERAAKSAGDVCNDITRYPFKVFITESFKVPDASTDSGFKYVTPSDPDELAALRTGGYTPYSFVQSVSKVG